MDEFVQSEFDLQSFLLSCILEHDFV